MPKIIVKIKHLKTSKSVGNFVNYIAKRDSVDMSLNQKVLVGKPTKKQVDFIDKMLEAVIEVYRAQILRNKYAGTIRAFWENSQGSGFWSCNKSHKFAFL